MKQAESWEEKFVQFVKKYYKLIQKKLTSKKSQQPLNFLEIFGFGTSTLKCKILALDLFTCIKIHPSVRLTVKWLTECITSYACLFEGCLSHLLKLFFVVNYKSYISSFFFIFLSSLFHHTLPRCRQENHRPTTTTVWPSPKLYNFLLCFWSIQALQFCFLMNLSQIHCQNSHLWTKK